MEEKTEKKEKKGIDKKVLALLFTVIFIVSVVSVLGYMVYLHETEITPQFTTEQNYTQRLKTILDLVESGRLEWKQALPLIKEIVETAEHHETPPWMWHSPPNMVVQQGSGVESVDYIIFGVDTDGDKIADEIYAKNGLTGEIEFSGTDAATVIQNTIDALPTYSYPYGGGTIAIKGTSNCFIYEITKKIVVDKPLRLVGDNRYGIVELRAAPGLNDRLLEVYKAGEDFWTEISRLKFEGNKNQQTSGDYLIYFYGGYPIMRDCYVMNAYQTGIYIHAQDFHFYNVYAEFCGKYGWDIRCTQNGQLYSCTAWGNGDAGIFLIYSHRWSLVNCRVMKNKGGSYHNAGLYIHSSSRGQVIGGYYCENDGPGIDLYNSDHIQIIGAMVRDNSQYANNTYDGIRIRGNSNHNIVNGCTIFSTLTNKQRYGVYEQDTADYNLIVGNIIHDNVSGQIYLIGTNSIQANNIVS
ncbi:right-handed parallel beta-helix repeat-containing protein [Candidatus Bathyarchaeota archaeon]|nr:MAG: right-handed parallel beta-helix repeat-containing protein [Candidatus Bathyarchaeota archaeon]